CLSGDVAQGSSPAVPDRAVSQRKPSEQAAHAIDGKSVSEAPKSPWGDEVGPHGPLPQVAGGMLFRPAERFSERNGRVRDATLVADVTTGRNASWSRIPEPRVRRAGTSRTSPRSRRASARTAGRRTPARTTSTTGGPSDRRRRTPAGL